MRILLLFGCLVSFLFSCSSANKKNDNRELVRAHSAAIDGKLIAVEQSNTHEGLKLLDRSLVIALAPFNVVEQCKGSCDSCAELYYHGYFDIDANYMGALFLQAVFCGDPGEDQLIFATMDKKGRIADAHIVARDSHPAECAIRMTTRVDGKIFTIADSEECGILEGADEGMSSLDSTTSFYEISAAGKMVLRKKTHTTLVR